MSEQYTLYHFETCPYCARVRRFMTEAGLDLPLKNIHRDPVARAELIAGGGDSMVPCLRIEHDGNVRWLYESLDIIAYLREHAVPSAGA